MIRTLECCVRLSSNRVVFIAAALLFVSCFSAMNVLRDRLSPPSEKPSVFREAMRNVTKAARLDTASGSSHMSATQHPRLLLRYVKEKPFPHNKSASHLSGEKYISDLASILARFHSRVAVRARRVVNAHSFNYINNVPDACTGKTVETLLGVPSRVDSFTQRQAIRETWGQFSTVDTNKVVLLFFLGSTRDKNIQEKVAVEAQKHGDIVQETFIDSYRNLSLKSVALVRWVSLYCPDSTFVLKADDDMYINVPRLLSRLRAQFDKGPLFMMGTLHLNSRPFRTKGHKWFMPPSEYRQKLYPNYLSGTAYAMTTTAALRLYVESFYVRPLFLEDVYLTGILADKASVPRISDMEFSAQKIEPTGCKFKTHISGHHNTPEEIRKIHAELFDPDLRCKK
ncbi:hypothetical protein RRG08_015642 [Elysia crispata]|uniref:Hexosyltransferase n=1 Tax=Elysia crispata TaxID=231223 RepID=A0AAE0Y7Q3_9GAST|nr:hypothetical protein RRG08_015642 [Elysia crispata]